MPLIPATDADLRAVAALVNSGFRGETSRQGWTTEADFLDGERTDEAALRADLHDKPEARLYLLRQDVDLAGCVWLEPTKPGVWYLGMLTVRPDLQDRHLGRQLLGQAEAIARDGGARRIQMTVIHIRHELIAWYERRSYVQTAETKPFPYESPFGRANRPDLHFVVLEKLL